MSCSEDTIFCICHLYFNIFYKTSLLFSHNWIQIMIDLFLFHFGDNFIAVVTVGIRQLIAICAIMSDVPICSLGSESRGFAERCSQTPSLSLEPSCPSQFPRACGLLCTVQGVSCTPRGSGLCRWRVPSGSLGCGFAFHSPLPPQTCSLLLYAFSERENRNHIFNIF